MPLVKRSQLKKQSVDAETQTEEGSVNDSKLGVATEELFVLKTNWIKETVRKTIEIHDFILKMEDEDTKLKIRSPNFNLAGKEFSVDVHPNYNDSEYIAVFLHNYSFEDQVTSVTICETSGLQRSMEMAKIPAGKGLGFTMFLSHENYRKLAKVNGDVRRLKVAVTLHIKADGEGEGWTR